MADGASVLAKSKDAAFARRAQARVKLDVVLDEHDHGSGVPGFAVLLVSG